MGRTLDSGLRGPRQASVDERQRQEKQAHKTNQVDQNPAKADAVDPQAVDQAGRHAEQGDEGDVGPGLLAPDDGRYEQNALQAELGIGYQVGQQRAAVHPQT